LEIVFFNLILGAKNLPFRFEEKEIFPNILSKFFTFDGLF